MCRNIYDYECISVFFFYRKRTLKFITIQTKITQSHGNFFPPKKEQNQTHHIEHYAIMPGRVTRSLARLIFNKNNISNIQKPRRRLREIMKHTENSSTSEQAKGKKIDKKNPTQNEFNFPSLLPSLRCVYMRSHHSAVESFPFRRLTKLETFEHGKRSGARADELLLNSVDFPSTKSSCSTKSTSANPWDAIE